jgi:hypothetical protein
MQNIEFILYLSTYRAPPPLQRGRMGGGELAKFVKNTHPTSVLPSKEREEENRKRLF